MLGWDGIGSVVGSMNSPMHGFGRKGSDGDADGESVKSGLSGETLMGGKKGGSLVRRLFRRKGREGKGDE